MGPGSAQRSTLLRSARLLTGVYALATVVSLFLTLFAWRQGPSLWGELFGLLNVPVGPTFVSVVVLALVTRALLGRKRIGLWLVALFQFLGIYLGVVELAPAVSLPLGELWETRGDIGRGLDVAATVVALVVLWWLTRLRHEFTGRLARGSWWLSLGALAVGSAVTVGVAWVLLGAVAASRSQVRVVVGTVLAVFGGVSRRSLAGIPVWVVYVVAVCAAATILAAVVLFLASSRSSSRWSPDREVALRRLLAEHGAADSLGYFATRRDRASVLSPDGRAAVTYRVLAGVSLASGDPVGDPDSWGAAIMVWSAEARQFGWLPAVLAASEAGARAYAAAGLRVLSLGDEALLDARQFDARRASLSGVRRAAKRAARSGLVVQVRRQRELSPVELAEVTDRSEAWRVGRTDRGFSMALGRAADAADAEVLYVTATDTDGSLVGVLSFVPWGRSGVSLDLMRRAPAAPNGVTELMVTALMARASELGIARVSLNFCMFHSVFEDAERMGSRSLTRLNASVLGLFDRFWQLERLYRSTARYEPTWSPRFLCYDDVVSLPQVALAAAVAEGFLPSLRPKVGRAGGLDPAHLAQIDAIAVRTLDVASLGPRRSDQFRHRMATLQRMRTGGIEAYPVSASCPTTPIRAIGGKNGCETNPLSIVGRVSALRDHGSVIFATLVDGAVSVQVLLDAVRLGRQVLRGFAAFVDIGDLVRVDGVTGVSRTGTQSIMACTWRMEAKSLHPVPFRSFEDPRARRRQRSTDLIVHPSGVELLRQRATVVSSIRQTLAEAGFLEVETPMLHSTHGGASARPFTTFSNTYGVDLSLRIAPELYLKRLLVGGLGPIYELGRSFRNEGADATHNPEFTSLEVYQPHADYTTMRHLTEHLVRHAAQRLHGRAVLPLPAPGQGRTGSRGVDLVDISAPWPVVPVLDAVSRAIGRTVTLATDMDVLMGIATDHGVAVRPEMGPGDVVERLYDELVEPVTILPTFYTDFPVETSPLARRHRSTPGLAERWDLVIGGMEVGTAFSELTDPLDQRTRLTEQSLKAAAGDPEAMEVDEDFLMALETGMPPSGGLGIGVDRLIMLLTNTSIRDVLTFPFVRTAPTPLGAREVTPSWS
ncbi:MAG: bifunctional lysylphosphatidylglycerol synthetase/lysine--tRNA ligase LysX [Actinomycetota bacterium]|nr:bifunctional lysylphosphatidylglycerol synthetase/lysine--tRNA ligase LysX [Actinomycetota bacterium]